MSSRAAAAPGGPSASPWLLGPARDLLLLVATPLLIVPAIWLASVRWPAASIYLFVASFGALGHHLPGMMRAYGDRALFRRFRLRFVLAPLFLVAVCVGFAWYELSVVLLTVFLWGTWHGLMQVHGFARIYDGRVGSFARRTAWLDFAACLIFFSSAIVFSETRVHFFLDHFYRAGGAALPAAGLATLRAILAAAMVLVALAYLVHAWQCRRAGQAQSPVKHLLLLGSIAFFWYANVFVANLLLAVVLFEIFHDVQYLTIVWIFNRKRVERDPEAGRFTRFVFRKSPLLIGLYLGLIFAYGSLNIVQDRLFSGSLAEIYSRGLDAVAGAPGAAAGLTAAKLLAGVLAASALLHFYYDGFIWKVREAGTRAALGLAGGSEEPAARSSSSQAGRPLPGWARHGLKWALFFVVPLAGLGLALAQGPPDEDERQLMIAATMPDDPGSQRNRALVLYKRGDLEAAVAANRKALALQPGDEDTRSWIESDLTAMLFQLGLRSLAEGRPSQAAERLFEAQRLDAALPRRAFDAALALGAAGERSQEELHYRAALLMDSSLAEAQYNLAVNLAQQRRFEEALAELDRAEELLPGNGKIFQLRQRLRAQAAAAAAAGR